MAKSVEIRGDGYSTRVFIDGQEIDDVLSYRVSQDAGESAVFEITFQVNGAVVQTK